MTCLRPPSRRAFTLVELMLAIVIASFVIGSIWSALGQITRSRVASRDRMLAAMRADAALNAIRRDVMSVLRSDDLFVTRLRILDGFVSARDGMLDRDDLLVFSSRLRPIREIEWQGEGIEYEVQYRVMDDAMGYVLWQRRDAVPDEYYDGGGVATPLVEGISSFSVEAYDGNLWWSDWDSDLHGLPRAVRIVVVAPVTGAEGERPIILRTTVSIDRVLPPFDAETEEDEEDDESSTTSGNAGNTGSAGEAGGSNQNTDGGDR
jgi:prepilin-type N-terminal cleavage/methylation domain-containing protein